MTPHEVARCLEKAFETKLAPGVSDALLESVDVLKSFLHHHGFIEHDFPLRDWVAAEPLAEARRRGRKLASDRVNASNTMQDIFVDVSSIGAETRSNVSRARAEVT